MSKHQTKFSKYIRIDEETELQWVKAELQNRQRAAYQSGAGFFGFQCTEEGVWLHSSSENPIVDDIEAVERFLQDLLIQFRPEEVIGVEYAFCSDDSNFSTSEQLFGGGASLITAKEVMTITTDVWLEQQLRLLKHQAEDK